MGISLVRVSGHFDSSLSDISILLAAQSMMFLSLPGHTFTRFKSKEILNSVNEYENFDLSVEFNIINGFDK